MCIYSDAEENLENICITSKDIKKFLKSDYLYSHLISEIESKITIDIFQKLINSKYIKELDRDDYLDLENNFNLVTDELFETGYLLGIELTLKLMECKEVFNEV